MQAPFALNDDRLQYQSVCPLYAQKEVDLLAGPAEDTFRWAVRARYLARIMKPVELREHFVDLWRARWPYEAKTLAYWDGPKAAPAFARRVYEFLNKFNIAQPFEPYTLALEEGIVVGSKALATWTAVKRPSEPVTLVLDVRLKRPRDPKTIFYRELAQWLSARQDSDTVSLGVLHVPLLWGESWVTNEINEPLARSWLNAILKEARQTTQFPRTGPQCITCLEPCKKIYQIQSLS